jgi:hypothetical protein
MKLQEEDTQNVCWYSAKELTLPGLLEKIKIQELNRPNVQLFYNRKICSLSGKEPK